jgi:hypothetical protein
MHVAKEVRRRSEEDLGLGLDHEIVLGQKEFCGAGRHSLCFAGNDHLAWNCCLCDCCIGGAGAPHPPTPTTNDCCGLLLNHHCACRSETGQSSLNNLLAFCLQSSTVAPLGVEMNTKEWCQQTNNRSQTMTQSRVV